MPAEQAPTTAEDLAAALRDHASENRIIELGGNFTKSDMGGKIQPPGLVISTRRLNRVLIYEPADLTISVEAGLPYRELRETLAGKGQFLPLDPPFDESATIGGVVAATTSGWTSSRTNLASDASPAAAGGWATATTGAVGDRSGRVEDEERWLGR